MVAAVALYGVCTECLEKHCTLNDAGVCIYCRRYVDRPEPAFPPWPTTHLPGTEGRLIVMEWRAQNGFKVLHPDDSSEDPRGSGDVTYWPTRRDLEVHVYATVM